MTLRKLACVAAAFLVAATAAHAQPYPAKPVRFILPFPTGPGFLIGQVLSENLRETFKQNIVSEARPGAGGSIAMELVARSAPDGYTLLVASPILTITPVARPSLKLDSVRDFTPVTLFGTIPNLMAVHPSVPVRNVAEFIREARVKPGRLTYGSSGPGSTNHMVTELFSMQAKVKLGHIPYKSATFAVVDLIRGDVDMVIGAKTSVAQFIATDKLRFIAVLSNRRLADMPDVPTIVEQGLPGLVVENYYGILGPRGMPADVVDRLHREIVRIGTMPEVRKTFAKADIDLVLSTPAEFADFIKADSAKWARVAREANLKLE